MEIGSLCWTTHALKWMHFEWIAMGCCFVCFRRLSPNSTHCSSKCWHTMSRGVPFLLPPLLHTYKTPSSTQYQQQPVKYSECWYKWPAFYRCSTPAAQLETTVNSATLNSSCKTAYMIIIHVGLERASRVIKSTWQSYWHSQWRKHWLFKWVVLLKTNIILPRF